MGWNGSGQKGAAPVQPKVTTKKPSPIRGLVAGGLVIVLAAVAYFAFFSGSEKPQKERTAEKERGRIKEVTPAAAPKAAEEPVAKVKKPAKPKTIPYWEQENTNGFSETMQLKWRIMRRPRHEPVEVDHGKGKWEIFEHESENLIAGILDAVPGVSTMIGSVDSPNLEEDFLKSCEVPIIVSPDDDEYTKNLKKAMNETKIELRERMANGEKFLDIINESRKEFDRASQVVESMRDELRELAANEASNEDIDDYIASANKLLEQKGIAPFRNQKMLKRQLQNYRNRKIKQKAKALKEENK